MTESIEIGIILYPDAQEAAFLGLLDLFTMANRKSEPDKPQLQVSRWMLKDGRLERETGGGGRPAVLLVPPGSGIPIQPEAAAAYGESLAEFHAAGGILTTVCAGSFMLAEAGILKGRTATTHWAFQDEFRRRFPDVRLDIDRLIVDDGDIITAGGMMAWTDLGLKLVDRFLGPSVMFDVARTLVVDPPGREQRYYSTFVPFLNHGDTQVLRAQHFMHGAYAEDHPIGELANVAGLGDRTFLRRFRAATGLTTSVYLQNIRINKARELLQFTALSADRIAHEIGYSDAGVLRKIFLKVVGLSPAEYRRRFHG